MWTVLKQASEQPGVVVTVYVDGDKADAIKVKAQLPRATVYRSAELPTGKRVVSHAKFIVIDHEVLLLTSANFSFSAENRNVEFGAPRPRRRARRVRRVDHDQQARQPLRAGRRRAEHMTTCPAPCCGQSPYEGARTRIGPDDVCEEPGLDPAVSTAPDRAIG